MDPNRVSSTAWKPWSRPNISFFQVRKPTTKGPEHRRDKAECESQAFALCCGWVWAAGRRDCPTAWLVWDWPSGVGNNYILHRRDLLVPFSLPAVCVKTRRQDPASSHILKTYSGLVFTIPRMDVTWNSRAHLPLEEPHGLLRGSLGPRPQAPETLPSGLQLRESCQGVSLSFRS